ncbi:MAG: response regulator, partial [Methanobacteriota archaeon]
MISVLYIDDTPGLLREGKQFLERTGSFTVNTAVSGIDALNLISHTKYDIIISSYEMAGMSGLELLSQIRENYEFIPFIFMRNNLPSHPIEEGAFQEADYFIIRQGSPIQIYEELSIKIHRAVKRRRREQVLRKRNQEKENQKNPFQDGTWVVNAEGTTVYGGGEIASILGYPIEQL